MIIQRTRAQRYLDGQHITTIWGDTNDNLMEQFVIDRPGNSFVVEVSQFDTETKQFVMPWTQFYTINAESIATKAI